MGKVQSIHDKFLKQNFSDLRIAREFFESYLPKDIRQKMNLSSLRLESETFIDEELSMMISDMVFSIKIDGKVGYIYTLLEHWSTADKKIPLRLMRYTLAIMHKHLKMYNTTTLPIVYPVVLYQNKKPYQGARHIFEMFEPKSQDLARTIFKNPFQIVDLATIEDETLIQHELLGVVLLYMKHICRKDVISLVRFFDYLQKISQKYGYDIAEQAIIYIIQGGNSEHKDELLNKVLTELPQHIGEDIMTIAEQLKQEGFEKGQQEGMLSGMEKGMASGMEKGMASGMEKGRVEGVEKNKRAVVYKLFKRKMNLKDISDITDLSIEELKKLQVSYKEQFDS